MMYSDYFALSSCAISVVFIPFMIVCLLRYGLVLQVFNYENAAYFRWLRCAFLAAGAPLIAIVGLALLGQAVFYVYLTHTAATELMIIIGYAVFMLLICGLLALAFGRFCRVLGGAGWLVPRIDDRRLQLLFLLSGLVVGVAMLLLNLLNLQIWINFMPLATPFLMPAVNLLFKPYPGQVKAAASGGFFEETRPLREEMVSQDTQLYRRPKLDAAAPAADRSTGGTEQGDTEER